MTQWGGIPSFQVARPMSRTRIGSAVSFKLVVSSDDRCTVEVRMEPSLTYPRDRRKPVRRGKPGRPYHYGSSRLTTGGASTCHCCGSPRAYVASDGAFGASIGGSSLAAASWRPTAMRPLRANPATAITAGTPRDIHSGSLGNQA